MCTSAGGEISKGKPLCCLIGGGSTSCAGAETIGRAQSGWEQLRGMGSASPASWRESLVPCCWEKHHAPGSAVPLSCFKLAGCVQRSGLKVRIVPLPLLGFQTWGWLAVGEVVGVVLRRFGGGKKPFVP